jgi:uncharacterized protein (TIGR02646 family)
MGEVFKTLCEMAGKRERCMYCEDSRSVDIEHFFPKAHFTERSFRWANMLAICTGCNRCKGDTFPVFSSGRPKLLDPTMDDPWLHLFYDWHTGEVTAAVRSNGKKDPRGSHTLKVLDETLNHEAVTDGRTAARRNLVRAVERFLQDVLMSGPGPATKELISAVQDCGSYGIADWCFQRHGSTEDPFRRFRKNHPTAWNAVIAIL